MANKPIGSQQFASSSNCAHLRRVLNFIFPPAYIRRHHLSGPTVCPLLSTKCCGPSKLDADGHSDCTHEASSEPTSRASLASLSHLLDSSLLQLQAKPVGLCPIRRAIYDQLFDELIRQVTVGCVEQGLLLFRLRNELHMTISSYRTVYESGVEFGLSKAIGAELELEQNSVKVCQLEKLLEERTGELADSQLEANLKLRNRLESVDRMKEFYEAELDSKNAIIKQQRESIRLLSQKSLSAIKNPL